MHFDTRELEAIYQDRHGCGDELVLDRLHKQLHRLHQIMDPASAREAELDDDEIFDFDAVH